MIFELVKTLGLDTYVAYKIVNAIDMASTVWGAVALLGTVLASAGIGAAVIGVALAMFKRVAKQMGKKAARAIVVGW